MGGDEGEGGAIGGCGKVGGRGVGRGSFDGIGIALGIEGRDCSNRCSFLRSERAKMSTNASMATVNRIHRPRIHRNEFVILS